MIRARHRAEAVYVGNGRVLTRTPHGLKLFVDATDVSIAPHLILDGVWEEWTEAVLHRLLRPGMIVIEVGTNVGFFTLLTARAVGESGHVYSFEADPTLAQIARDNVDINGQSRVVEIVEKAASDREGTLTFYAADRHRGGGSIVAGLEQMPHNPSGRNELRVESVTLDGFIGERGIERVDLVKIDAEGAESAILRGAMQLLRAGKPLCVLMEFSPEFFRKAGDDPAHWLDVFAECGFTVSRINERRRTLDATTRDELLSKPFSEIVCRR